MKFDKIIIGAGIYGLYAALLAAKKNQKVLVLEAEKTAFSRATYVNQARLHNGYHYPRSLTTAMKSAHYFQRFFKDYGDCINSEFTQVYATAKNFSWTNAEQFKNFCQTADILCQSIPTSRFFHQQTCDGAFVTTEYTFDADELSRHFLKEIKQTSQVKIIYSTPVTAIKKQDDIYQIFSSTDPNTTFETPFILNATYANLNQILRLLGEGDEKTLNVPIKYELCEVIICKVPSDFSNIGVTVMDGPFFSLMPFGNTGFHSLTAVAHTPHQTCYQLSPHFSCQMKNQQCSPDFLANCNTCACQPSSAWPQMLALTKKYLLPKYYPEYSHSIFTVKPILLASEIDDSRPTVIIQHSNTPDFYSVLSGKINTIYDLDQII